MSKFRKMLQEAGDMAYAGFGLDEVIEASIRNHGELAKNHEEDLRGAWEDGHRDYCIDARYGHDPRLNICKGA